MATPLKYDNRFSVSGLTYPADLMTNKAVYGGNYVIFRINVHEDSKLAKDPDSSYVTGNLPARKRGEVAGMSAATLNMVPGAATAITAVASGAVSKGAGFTGTDLTAAGEGIAGLAVGALGATAFASSVGHAKQEYKTMRQAIALYMPGDISVRYGATWEETSLDTTAALVNAAPALLEAAGKVAVGTAVGAGIDALAKAKGFNTRGAGKLIGAAAGAAWGADQFSELGAAAVGQGLKTPGVGELLSKSSGTATNPKKEQLFKSVDFRTFTFSYQFFPKSAGEAQAVREIIKQFKLHMHPEFKNNSENFLYIYPSEFDIQYYNQDQENLNLHRHTSCVLTDLTVSYAPQGVFTAFADGMPTQVNLQMTFKELSILTKDDILDGY